MRLTDYYTRVASRFSMDTEKAMEILGIKGTGDFQEDKSLLRGFVNKYHPDKTVGMSGNMSKEMQAVNVLQETYIREGKPLPTVITEKNTVHPEENTVTPKKYPGWLKRNMVYMYGSLAKKGLWGGLDDREQKIAWDLNLNCLDGDGLPSSDKISRKYGLSLEKAGLIHGRLDKIWNS